MADNFVVYWPESTYAGQHYSAHQALQFAKRVRRVMVFDYDPITQLHECGDYMIDRRWQLTYKWSPLGTYTSTLLAMRAAFEHRERNR